MAASLISILALVLVVALTSEARWELMSAIESHLAGDSCHRKMTAVNNKPDRRYFRYYWCRGSDPHRIQERRPLCPHPTVRAPPHDALVWADVVALLTDSELLLNAWEQQQGKPALASGDVFVEEKRKLKRQLGVVEQQRQRLLIAYEQQAIELEELSCRRKILEDKTRELQRRLQGLEMEYQEGIVLSELGENLNDVCRQLVSGLEEMNMPQRMKLCSQLIDKIIVDGTAPRSTIGGFHPPQAPENLLPHDRKDVWY